jgi:photosystem II stability/assembly factor-like uncharacterized protein
MAALLIAGASPFSVSAMHPSDAAIRSLQFVDANEGWAVGDDGVIWHSIDGGQNWERQTSGVRASLRAVHFLTPYTGWVVGRVDLPGGSSQGVVLATTDGGLKWTQVAANAIPGLNCVRFFNQRNGIAAGDGSDLYPTGLFTTSDGGQTWKPVPGKRCPTWLAADFSDIDTGALGGPWSQLATVRNGLFGAADIDPLGGRSIKGLKLNGSFAVAVGQGGLILTSSASAGMKWGFSAPHLPKEVLAVCDFSAVAVRGKHLWVAGRPGTFVLHSPDLGQNWEFQKTGQTLPLHNLYFFDENLGWAAGEMGTLLLTQNGGKTWSVARQNAQRAAVLFVHASSATLPLETIALLGEDEGYHTVAIRLTCAAVPSPPARLPEDDRPPLRKIEPTGSSPAFAVEPEKLSAAMRFAGGSAGESLWQFPLSRQDDGLTPEQLLGQWDKLHGEPSRPQVLRQLVLAIRLWRPEVVVVDGMNSASPAQIIVAEAMKEAFKTAADPQVFPEQLTMLKLSSWAPKKLYAVLDRPDPAAVNVPIFEVKTRLGDCAHDFAQPAVQMLAESVKPAEQRCCFGLLSTRLPDAVGDGHLLQGIELAYGGQARRDLPPLGEDALNYRKSVEKSIQVRRTLEALVDGKGGDVVNSGQVLAQIGQSLKDMPAEFGARAAYTIARRYADSGQWVFARETFLLLADRYPNHPLAMEAYRWLIRYQSSSEARRREELGHFAVFTETSVNMLDKNKNSKLANRDSEIVQANHLVYLKDGEDTRQWFKGSLAVEAQLQKFGAMYANDPAMQLCLNSARRQLGDTEPPKKWYSLYLSGSAVPLGGQTVVRGADPWRDCAMAELWLASRTVGTSPAKPLAYCPRIETKPVLDGKLDDSCWQGVQPLTLNTVAGELETAVKRDQAGKLSSEYTTTAWFVCDAEYLYIAVHCTHPIGKRVPPVEKRGRDMDLRGFDRVSILLDLDRDYQTYFHLQIDQRGCLAEDCWGDSSWNPQWFVAIASDESSWTAEAAIPMKELIAKAPAPGTTWAANVTRIVPGKGLQAWSTPADAIPRPEGMGLLQFIEKRKQ